MIINNQYQFIYIHVPKTAGTAVSTALMKYAGPADIDLGGAVIEKAGEKKHEIAVTLNQLWNKHWGIEKHSNVMRLRARLGPALWNRYFKFAFVRNPFSKTYSGFKFAQRHRTLKGALDQMSFSDFLRSDIFQKLQILPIQAQAAFLNPVAQVDFIGRFEHLAADLALVASIIERRRVASVAVETLNRSAEPEEWRAMSEADKDIIRDVLSADFDELGYSKEDGSIVREL
jgi:hypothetical protein